MASRVDNAEIQYEAQRFPLLDKSRLNPGGSAQMGGRQHA